MIASAAVIFSLGHKQQQNAIIGRCVGYLSYIRDIDIRDTIIASVFIYLPYSTKKVKNPSVHSGLSISYSSMENPSG